MASNKTVKLYHPNSPETQVEVSEERAEVLKERGYVTKKSDASPPES